MDRQITALPTPRPIPTDWRLTQSSPSRGLVILLGFLCVAWVTLTVPIHAVAQPVDPDAAGIVWIAKGGFQNMNKLTSDLDILLTVDTPVAIDALAVDVERQVVWGYGEGTLIAFDYQVNVLFSGSVPDSAEAVGIVVDERDGSVWLAVSSTLYHYSPTAELLNSFAVSDPIVQLGLDDLGYHLWIGHAKAVTSYDPDTGSAVASLDLGKGNVLVQDFDLVSAPVGTRLFVLTNQGLEDWTIAADGTAGNAALVWDPVPLEPSVVTAIYRLDEVTGATLWHWFVFGAEESWHYEDLQEGQESAPTVGLLQPVNPTHEAVVTQIGPPGSKYHEVKWYSDGYSETTSAVHTSRRIQTREFDYFGTSFSKHFGTITALAVTPRELTSPVLTIDSPLDGSWSTTSTPVFEVSYQDLASAEDSRISGVDPGSLVFDRMVTDDWLEEIAVTCSTGSLQATCATVESTSPFTTEGRKRVRVQLTDFALVRTTEFIELYFDFTLPTVQFESPTDGAVLIVPRPDLTVFYDDPGTSSTGVSGVDPGSLRFLANGNEFAATCSETADGATCTPDVALPLGAVTLEARVSDIAGNSASELIQVTVEGEDTTPPSLSFTLPAEDAEFTSFPTLEIAYSDGGQGVDLTTLQILANGAPLAVGCTQQGEPVAGTLTCTTESTLAAGPVALEATIADLEGNVSAPALRSFQLVEPFTTVEGRIVDEGGLPLAGAEVWVEGKSGSATVSGFDGTFTISGVPVRTGEHLTVGAFHDDGIEKLAGTVSEIAPVYGGVTAAGDLMLSPLCQQLVGPFRTPFPNESRTIADLRILAMEVFDDGSGPALYVGGEVTDSSLPNPGVWKWDGTVWSKIPEFDDIEVRHLAVFDAGSGPELFAITDDRNVKSGWTCCPLPTEFLVSWDGEVRKVHHSIWDSSDEAIGGIEVHDDGSGQALYLSGENFKIGVSEGPDVSGTTFDRVARWDGQDWEQVDTPLGSPTVGTLLSADLGAGPKLYAAIAAAVGGDPLVAVWDGDVWQAIAGLQAPENRTGLRVNDLEVHDDGSGAELWVAGEELNPTSLPTGYYQLLRWDGTSWSAPTPQWNYYYASVDVLISHHDGEREVLFVDGPDGIYTWSEGVWKQRDDLPGVEAFAEFRAPGDPVKSLYLGGHFVRVGPYPSPSVARWYRACSPPDLSGPVVTLTSPGPEGVTSSTQTMIAGILDEPGRVWIDGQEVPVDAALSFAYGPVSLVEGLNVFGLRAVDDAGNPSEVELQIVRDTASPTIEITSPPAGGVVTRSRPEIELGMWDGPTGGGVDPATVGLRLDGSPLPADCKTSGTVALCRPLLDLSDGSHSLEAEVADFAANVSTSAPVSFTVDGSSAPLPTTVIGRVVLGGGVPAAGAEVVVLGQSGARTISGSDGRFTISGVDTGPESLTVTASLTSAEGQLLGAATGISPVAGGSTDVGDIQLRPLCELTMDWDFNADVGADGDWYWRLPDSVGTYIYLTDTANSVAVFDDGTGPDLYLGGLFKQVAGVPAKHIARWDGQTWSALGSNVRGGGTDAWVQDLVVYDDGTGPALYAAGFFGLVDGIPASRIAKWDGSTWTPLPGSFTSDDGNAAGIWDLQVWDSRLWVGGHFNSVNGVAARNVAGWNGTSWEALGEDLGFYFVSVYSLGEYDAVKGKGTTLYAGGDFEYAGNTVVNGIAAWDGQQWVGLDGGVSVDNFNASDTVSALLAYDGVLWVGGSFGRVGTAGLYSPGAARWDGRGWSAAPGLDVSSNTLFREPEGIEAFVVYDDGSGESLYALGDDRGLIMRWDGTQWQQVPGYTGSFQQVGNQGMGMTVFDPDGSGVAPAQLFVASGGGTVRRADGTWHSSGHIAAWDGEEWSALDEGVRGIVSDMVVHDDGSGPALFVLHGRITRWDGKTWRALPQGGSSLAVVTRSDGTEELYLSGDFSTTRSSTSTENAFVPGGGIVRWDGTSFRPVAGSMSDPWVHEVRELATFDDGSGEALYGRIGSNSSDEGPAEVGKVGRWNGMMWEPVGWGNEFGHGNVDVLYGAEDGLYAAGRFSKPGADHDFIARWTGSEWESLGEGLGGSVNAMVVADLGDGPRVFAGGRFEQSGSGAPLNYIAQWDGTSWSQLGSGVNDIVSRIHVVDDGNKPALYVSGSFEVAGGRLAPNFAKWDGQEWTPLGQDLDGSFRAVAFYDHGEGLMLYAGGKFAEAPYGGPGSTPYTGGEISYLGRFTRPLTCGQSDGVAPELTFEDPLSGSTVYTERPSLRVSYSDGSSGVDVSTLAFRRGGQPLAVDCVTGAFEATCALLEDLPEGPVDLEATISDLAGNVSSPATTSFTVDLGPPSLSVTVPHDGDISLSNIPTVSFAYTANADPNTLVPTSEPTAVSWDCLTQATSADCTALAPLAEGMNRVTATVQDAGGQTSAPAGVDFTVDTEAPLAGIVQPSAGEVVLTDRPTIEVSYSDTGAGVDTASLALELDGTPLGADCTPGPASATCTPVSALADGPHTVTATVDDFAGRTSAPSSVGFTVDTSDVTPPVISNDAPIDGSATTVPETTFTGTLSEPGTLTFDGVPVTVAPDNTYSHGPVTLVEGWNRFELVATDGSGNSTTEIIRVLLDTAPPVLSFLAPEDGGYFDPAVEPIELRWGDSGAGIDTASFELRVDGAPFDGDCTFCGSGATCTPSGALTGTVITLTATVADAAGNGSAQAGTTFTTDPALDILAPVIFLTHPDNGSVTEEPEQMFSGHLSEPAALTLNGDPVTVQADNSFVHGPVTLSEGDNRFDLVATDPAGNVGLKSLSVTLDSTPPAPVVSSLVSVSEPVAGRSTVTGAAGAVSPAEGGSTVSIFNPATSAETATAVFADGSFSASLAAYGGDEVSVTVADTEGNRSEPRTFPVPGVVTLPADPATLAPALDGTVTTDTCGSTSFLYTGTDPVQVGVAAGAIDCGRVAVVRGRVLDRSGAGLSGVRLSVHRRGELGATLSRTDGAFDLVVNGGSEIVVSYVKDGYLPAQRRVLAPVRDWVHLPDVVLVVEDAAATAVDLTLADPIQVARGSWVTDADGSRRATLMFAQGTTAELVFDGGARKPVTSLTVRATEYTVGPEGPRAMPAELPQGTSYTYAVELSADEVGVAGADSIEFSQPVLFYLENFLGFPAGTPVPAGFYDREAAVWRPSRDGRVVTVTSVAGGIAELDVDGSGLAADAATLADLGITDSERQELATLYATGQSLWRVEVDHFTPWDFNYWAWWELLQLRKAKLRQIREAYENQKDIDCERLQPVIECTNQILEERLAAAGTSSSFTYRSDRVEGRKANRTLGVGVLGSEVPQGLQRVDLELQVAGQKVSRSLTPTADLSTEMSWDGRDAYGRPVQGTQPYELRVGFVYETQYQQPPADCTSCFGDGGTGPITGDPARVDETVWSVHRGRLGGLDASRLGLGGWMFSSQHVFDPEDRTLYGGSGFSRRLADAEVTRQVAEATLPAQIATAPDGSIYFIDDLPSVHLVKVSPDGNAQTVLGAAGSGGIRAVDGADAGEVYMPGLIDVEVDTFGDVYLLDAGTGENFDTLGENQEDAVWRLEVDGTLRHILGDPDLPGNPLCTVDGIGTPRALLRGSDGSFYISDDTAAILKDGIQRNVVIHRVECGVESVAERSIFVAGNVELTWDDLVIFQEHQNDGKRFFLGDRVRDMVFGTDGSLFFTVAGGCSTVWRRWPDGLVTGVAGSYDTVSSSCTGFSGDGGPADAGQLDFPEGISVGPAGPEFGNLFVVDSGNHRVRKIDLFFGTIETVWGTGLTGTDSAGDLARRTNLWLPNDIEFLPTDQPVVSDTNHRRLLGLGPPPALQGDEIRVPSRDGNLVHVFDRDGRHLASEDALTGSRVAELGYRTEGSEQLLESVTDSSGRILTLERDAATGELAAAVAPDGQRTTFSLDPQGRIESSTDPAGRTLSFSYTTDGLLTGKTYPSLESWVYEYDALGRISKSTNPVGGFTSYARTDTEGGFQVSETTALGGTKTFVRELSGARNRQTTIHPDGTQTVQEDTPDGGRTVTYPDGTVAASSSATDPRFGPLAPRTSELSVTTPGGLAYAVTSTESSSTNPVSGELETRTGSVTVNGNTTMSVTDLANGTITTTTPEGRQGTTTFDAKGRVARTRIGGLAPVDYGYSVEGRLSSASQGDHSLTYTYDAQGRLQSMEDAVGRVVSYVYDASGRMTRQVLPDLTEISYTYDANGRLASITPPSRPAHLFGYTADGRRVSYTAPAVGAEPSTTQLTFDLDGRLERVDRPDGKAIVYGYDPVTGQLATETTSRGVYNFTYEAGTGRLSSVTDPDGGSLSYGYDSFLPTSVTWTGEVAGSITQAYDADFRVRSRSVNGAYTFDFAYSPDGLLVQAGSETLSYDPVSGLLTEVDLGGITTGLGYNSIGELTSHQTDFDQTALYSAGYTRDAAGRITQKLETIAGEPYTWDYTYDASGRLAEVRKDGTVFGTYVYGGNSNRMSATDPWGSFTATYDAQDRLLSYGDATYTYTAHGDLASKTVDGLSQTYEYDVHGNLRRVVTPDGIVIDYVIDAVRRRVGKKVAGTLVQGFLYGGQLNPIAELDGAGNVVSRFVYGSSGHVPDYMIQGGSTYRLITDHLGSVRLVVDTADGSIVQRKDYDPFGRVLLDTNPGFQPFGFAGGLTDSHTGLVRFGARDYDPETGRWTAKDPRGFDGGEENLYNYARSNPVNLVDPTGELAFVPLLAAVWLGAEIGFSMGDVLDVIATFMDGCATLGSKLESLVTALLGVGTPGSKSGGDLVRKYGDEFLSAQKSGRKIVIGHHPEYKELAERIDAEYFEVPKEVWDNLGDQSWAANRKFLDRAIERGDDILLATPIDRVRPGSDLEQELDYLVSKGYRVSDDGIRLVRD